MAARKSRAACTVNVGDTYKGYIDTFPLSRDGWSGAHAAAIKLTKDTGHLALVDLKCKGGTIPIYQCDRRDGRVSCVIENPTGHPGQGPIAGARRRRR